MRSYIRQHHSDEKQEVRAKIEIIFSQYLRHIGYFKEYPITRAKYHDSTKEFDSPRRSLEKNYKDEEAQYREKLEEIINNVELLKSNWKN